MSVALPVVCGGALSSGTFASGVGGHDETCGVVLSSDRCFSVHKVNGKDMRDP
jgi:hypothetical protein